jgi:hypothetical protein
MSLSKSKCWYSNNCLHFFKVCSSIIQINGTSYAVSGQAYYILPDFGVFPDFFRQSDCCNREITIVGVHQMKQVLGVPMRDERSGQPHAPPPH